MKVKMSRNHTNAYVIRRLSAWLIMTVFIAFGAGCDEANTDKDNEQPFHTSGVTSYSMNKAVNNDQILPAVQPLYKNRPRLLLFRYIRIKSLLHY